MNINVNKQIKHKHINMIYQNLHRMHLNIFYSRSPCIWRRVCGLKRYNIAEDRNPTRATLGNPPQFSAFAIWCSLFSSVWGTSATHINRAVHTPFARALSNKIRCL